LPTDFSAAIARETQIHLQKNVSSPFSINISEITDQVPNVLLFILYIIFILQRAA
jgi:hypothetical protein